MKFSNYIIDLFDKMFVYNYKQAWIRLNRMNEDLTKLIYIFRLYPYNLDSEFVRLLGIIHPEISTIERLRKLSKDFKQLTFGIRNISYYNFMDSVDVREEMIQFQKNVHTILNMYDEYQRKKDYKINMN